MTPADQIPARKMEELVPIAAAIIQKASLLDPRMKTGSNRDELQATIYAWAEILTESDVYRTEALKAVADHYRQPGAWPIMPGDVIAAVEKMPFTSSPERLRGWLRTWSYFPYSTAIQEFSGMDWHPTDPPSEVEARGSAAVRDHHRHEFQAWIKSQIDDIELAITHRATAGAVKAIGR